MGTIEEEVRNVRCPKCKSRTLDFSETCNAIHEGKIVDGHIDHFFDNNEYGLITRIEFICCSCGYRWTGRKCTIDDYLSLTPN